jgi:hypothetical protein
VYDATVKETHNFIADGVVAHNSLEQDADMVILLHREDAGVAPCRRGGPGPGQAPQRADRPGHGRLPGSLLALRGHGHLTGPPRMAARTSGGAARPGPRGREVRPGRPGWRVRRRC